MRRYLLDSGIAQDFVYKRKGVDERVIAEQSNGHRIGICVPVLGELWSGVMGSHSVEPNRKKLLRSVAELVLWPYTEEAAEHFGRIFTSMKKMGRPIQQIDMQIAAIAFTLSRCTVVSSDTDLAAIPGLKVVNWIEE